MQLSDQSVIVISRCGCSIEDSKYALICPEHYGKFLGIDVDWQLLTTIPLPRKFKKILGDRLFERFQKHAR